MKINIAHISVSYTHLDVYKRQEGKLPRVGAALMSDAVGTVVGACLGTSTVTTYVESASGVAEGGRTGMTSLVTAAMFGVALFFAPLFTLVPSACLLYTSRCV